MYPFSRQQISPATGKSLEIGAIFMIDQSLIMSNPMNCSPGSSVHGIFQESILQWVAISSFRESSQPRNWIHICFVRWILYHCTTCDLQGCANKSLTTSSLKKLSFACFVFFFFLSIAMGKKCITIDFKLPIQCHWPLSWKEKHN